MMPDIARECSSKRRYESVNEAESQIDFSSRFGRVDLRWYQCDFCHGFHLTSRP